MIKKLLGGVLLCGLLVPISVMLHLMDGVSIILLCIIEGLKDVLKPLVCKIKKLIEHDCEITASKKCI